MLSTVNAAFSRSRIRAASIGTPELGVLARRAVLVLLCLLAAGALVPQDVSEAAPPTQTAAEGQATFEKQCVACHTDSPIGPDLTGVTERRDPAWLANWISAPDEMLANNDPIATELLAQFNNLPMPNLRLSDTDVASLIAYLGTLSGGAAPAAAPAPAAPAPEGDPAVGKKLFTGTTSLRNDGPACIACHSITGIGAFGGGALGPDLTGSYNKLGTALITWPQTTPPMTAIFSEKPLTPNEEVHLLAFIEQAGLTARGSQAVWQLAGLSVAGVAVIVILVQLVWRRRLGNVRRPMVAGETSRS
ncbi:MAG: c-type cytochrome [SAR202 cluster bacterium]|nr:c-type cytochrome [SAR202 cluster bacterium]MQG68543.1 c-type cytochrome [SAR202 cluster bacterium]